MRLRLQRTAVLLVSVLAAAPAVALAVQATAPEQAAANEYFDCLVQTAQQQDDGVSEPSDVAVRIEPACVRQETTERIRFRSTLDPQSVPRFNELWPGVRTSMAVKAVLIVRSGDATLRSPMAPQE